MSLLFDQNVSRRLVSLLANEYPGSDHVVNAGLSGSDDHAVWTYATLRNLAIVSKDSDFRDMSARQGHPPKVIWLRVGNGPTEVIEQLLRDRQVDVAAFLSNPSESFLELP